MRRGGYWISEPQVSTIRACYLSQAPGSGGGRLQGSLAAPARLLQGGHSPCPPYSGEAEEEDLGGGSSHHNPGGREAWVPVPLC